jgi:hypothetical protein
LRRVKTKGEGHDREKGGDIEAFLLRQVHGIGGEEAALALADQRDIVPLEEIIKDIGPHLIAIIGLKSTEDMINAVEAQAQKKSKLKK